MRTAEKYSKPLSKQAKMIKLLFTRPPHCHHRRRGCGEIERKINMLYLKKNTALIISLCLCLSILCGCGNAGSKTDLTSDAETTAQISRDETPETFESGIPLETSDDTGKAVMGDSNMNATDNQIVISVNGHTLTATLAQNSSGEALKKLLEDGPMTISMRDYGDMEKVGDIGTSLPTNDEQITTEAGDLILYMGSAFVIYYAPNSWNFTRLGKIDNITAQELKNILGDGSVEVTLSLR